MQFVSVIIPNYNHEPYLQKRIDSVLNQTYKYFEVIILDDCSTDNSKEIIEKYRSNNKIVHIEYNYENSGSTFKQWKKGLDLANYNLVWIAESDDISEDSFLEKLVFQLNKDDSDLAFCNSNIIDKDDFLSTAYGFTNMPSKEHYSLFESDFTMNSNEFLINWMLTDNFIPNASAVIFKINSQVDYNCFLLPAQKMKLMGDWLFWIQILINSKSISYLSYSLNNFRNHTANVRTSRIKNRTLEFDEILKVLQSHEIDLKKSKSSFLYRYFQLFNSFKLSEHKTVFFICLKYEFYALYLKSLTKHLIFFKKK